MEFLGHGDEGTDLLQLHGRSPGFVSMGRSCVWGSGAHVRKPGCLKQIIAQNVNNHGRVLRKRNLLQPGNRQRWSQRRSKTPLTLSRSRPSAGFEKLEIVAPPRRGSSVRAQTDARQVRPKYRTELGSSHFRIPCQQTEWMV